MALDTIFAIVVLALIILFLAREVYTPDFILFAGVGLFLISGIIDPKEALSGFSNKGMITVGLLFIVSRGVENTGALVNVAERIMKKTTTNSAFRLLRMIVPVGFFSAFLNNTPIVVIFTPLIKKWAEKNGLYPSKFLIPLSYATIFGGVCTLIGTSTNLVVHGLMQQSGYSGLLFFELGYVGIPCALIGTIYLLIFSPRLLPERKDAMLDVNTNRKEYIIEVKVPDNYRFSGKTIGEAGLSTLQGTKVREIERGTETIPAESSEILQAGDTLFFVGSTDSLAEIMTNHGFIPVTDEEYDRDSEVLYNNLVEVVVSASSPLKGKRFSESGFRAMYDAALVALHRNGTRLVKKLSEIKLLPGDAAVLLTSKDFFRRFRDSQDFYMVSHLDKISPELSKRAIPAFFILVCMVMGTFSARFWPDIFPYKPGMFHFALLASLLYVCFGFLTPVEARKSVRMDVLITIASAFGISKGLQNSGAAEAIASFLVVGIEQFGPLGVLAVVYLTTTLFTEIITNNAAAALMFPIALAAAKQLGVDPKPFFVAIAIAASASFATPIGYQTNLIVKGAGGYRFVDYLKIGLPLNALFFTVSIIVIPFVWKF